MVLEAYFDDSGEDEQSVGGCVANADSWASFEPAWRAVLDQFYVEWFHARREHRKPGFPPMDEAERDEFRQALVGVLQDHVGVSVSRAVSGGAERWGGYVCVIVPPGSVDMLGLLDKADRVTHRQGKPQPGSSSQRFTEDIIALSNDPYGHCLQQAFGMAETTRLHTALSLVASVQLRGRHVSDDQLPHLSTSRPARYLGRTVGLGQRQPRFDQEGTAGVRELDSTARAMQETDPELALETTNLMTQRWLCDMKAPCRSTEVQLFRDGDEIAEVAKFHGCNDIAGVSIGARRKYWTARRRVA